MNNKFKGTVALLLATIIWGSAFVAQSVGMDYIGPFTFQAIRCLLAVLFLSAVVYMRHLKSFLRHLFNKDLWKAGILCGSALFAASSLQQIGLVYTDAGKAGFLTAMYIVMVPVIGFFFGRKLSVNAVISVLLAVIGLYLLSFIGVSSINIGDILLLGCAFAFAIQITCIDRLAGGLDALALNCIQCLVCGILSVPFMFLVETPDMARIIDCALPLSYAGILSLGVAYSLQIVGQKHLEPTSASLLMSLESVFAVLAGWAILGQALMIHEFFGCMFIFAAVILSQLPDKR